MAVIGFGLPLLIHSGISTAHAQDATSLTSLREENAKLREELAALRERDHLRAEIATVRSRVERRESATSSAIFPATTRAAYAADQNLVYKATPVSAPVEPGWTGFYLGLAAGVRAHENEARTSSITEVLAGTNFPVQGYPGAPITLDGTSALVGPYLGFNWQFAPRWLVGIEGEWSWADKTTTAHGMLYPIATAPEIFSQLGAPETFGVRTSWEASVRARIGYLVSPSVLLYAAAGPSWIHVESTSTCANPGDVNTVCSAPGVGGPFFTQQVITDSSTKVGWTIGGGVEAMIGAEWTVRADYRYSDYGTIRNTDTRQLLPFPALVFGLDTFNVAYEQRLRTNAVMVGLARKLDW